MKDNEASEPAEDPQAIERMRANLVQLLAMYSSATGGSVPMPQITDVLLAAVVAALDGLEERTGPLQGHAKVCRYQLHAIRRDLAKVDWREKGGD